MITRHTIPLGGGGGGAGGAGGAGSSNNSGSTGNSSVAAVDTSRAAAALTRTIPLPGQSGAVLTVLLMHFHHMLNPDKREVVQEWAHELDLGGT